VHLRCFSAFCEVYDVSLANHCKIFVISFRSMKRNTLRLLKYLTYVLVFVIVGPGLLRFLFGDNSQAIDPIKIHQAHGLPESPEEMKRDIEVSCFCSTLHHVQMFSYYLQVVFCERQLLLLSSRLLFSIHDT